jgi:hypothetical protein
MKRILFLLFLSSAARAELPMLWESPGATVSTELGVGQVRIDYHRPGVKGREIWGKVVPYGQVWRAGANEATTLTVAEPVQLAGRELAAGKYALFVLPVQDKWTFIVSKKSEQWGAYFYNPKDDVLRVDVVPATGPPVEWLTWQLVPTSDHSMRVELAWDKLRGGFELSADVTGRYKKRVLDEVAKLDPKDPKAYDTYLVAIGFWNRSNLDAQQALGWADAALKLSQHFWCYEAKANTLHRLGRDKEAAPLLDKAMQLAKGKAPDAYIEGLKKKKAEWKL